MRVAEQHGVEPRILQAVDDVNNRQKHVLFEKLTRRFGTDLTGRKIAVWGLAFKPRTDDIREAPALVLIDELLGAGAEVHVHDPEAMDNVRRQFGDRIAYHAHHYDALAGADALVICTEWNEYRNPDFDYMRHKMRSPVICDGRNLWQPDKMSSRGFEYSGIGLHTP
jgi:UDPglucose 6-dehydrogenase